MGELDFRLVGGFLIPNATLQCVFLEHKAAFVVVWYSLKSIVLL